MTPTLEQEPALPRIAVVIVTQNQSAALLQCLAGLAGQELVIVVDNGADDTAGFEEKFPKVRLIRLPRNFGQTKALNLGIRAAEAEMVLLLAPQVQITGETIGLLAETLETQPGVGAVCPLLLASGSASGAASGGAAVNQVSDLPSPAQPDPPLRPARPGEQPACATADAILFRSFFLRALRHIDERYGDFGSAPELCQQVRRSNKTILIHPSATAVRSAAEASRTTAQEADRTIGISRFLGKHYGFFSGLRYLLGRVFAALFQFRFRTLTLLVSQKKIDGN